MEIMTCLYGHECSFTPRVDAIKCKACLMYRIESVTEINRLNDVQKKGISLYPKNNSEETNMLQNNMP